VHLSFKYYFTNVKKMNINLSAVNPDLENMADNMK
jgi:hypothetical protein